MRIAGIDPGTKSFDLFGMEDDQKIIIDESIESVSIFNDPYLLLKKLEGLLPLDLIVGPSGYGMPAKLISDMTEDDLAKMIPLDTKLAVNEGIRKVLLEMKKRKMPVLFTPGAFDLPTIPSYRKWNKFDMGTADKVCCVALGIKDQSERLKIPFEKTSFIYVEVGYGFVAVMAIENGKIVDGIGGTNGSLGFIASGGMDAELAIRLRPPLTQEIVFKGGLKDFVGGNIEPENLADYPQALTLLTESIEKDVAAILVSAPNPKEVILSGRLTNYDFIREELTGSLEKYASVTKITKPSTIAKEAACGAYLIGEGWLGGKYESLVKIMGIAKA